MSTSELACTYAALALHDDGINIDAEKMATLIKAANINCESYWPTLFAKLLQKTNVEDLILNAGATAASAPVAVGDNAPVAAATAGVEEKKEEKKEVVEEDSDDDFIGISLFD